MSTNDQGPAQSITPSSAMNGSGAITGKVTSYNGIATQGWGVPAIQMSGRAVAQIAAVTTVGSVYTLGAADGTFLIFANVLVTTSTTHNFSVTVTYTDESNAGRTATLFFTPGNGGAIQTTVVNTNGATAYQGIPLVLQCKASTTITIATSGTFTTVTYNVGGQIAQIA